MFNVAQLLKEPSGSSRTGEVDEVLTLEDDGRASRIAGSMALVRTDKGVWVSAALDSQVVCTCSRCLKEYEQPIHMTIEEEYLPLVDIHTGARLPPANHGEESFYIDHDHSLDLGEAARQYSALSTPMKPVCSDACAGICVTCGANLNESPCTCDKTPRDSRWGPLIGLVSLEDQQN